MSELNVFCRLPVEVDGETFNVVAGMLDDRPGEIIVRTNDDNDYFDGRFPVRSIPGAAGIKLRESDDRYLWENLMIQARDEVVRGRNG